MAANPVNFIAKHATDGIDFRPAAPAAPPKTPFEGTHFSSDDVKGGVLEGARRGSSPESSDAHRVHTGNGAVAGVHVYRKSFIGHPSVASRKHSHNVSGNYAVADIDGAQNGLWSQHLTPAYQAGISSGMDHNKALGNAINESERGLQRAGFDGYEASKTHPGNVFLFGDVPINRPHNV